MKLITGGTAQGKSGFAKTLCRNVINGADADISAYPAGYDCIDDCHILIKRLIEAGIDHEGYFTGLMKAYPDMVFVMAEIGCGILPLDKDERRYREAVGRTGCLIAENSDEVYRLICGIAQRIK
ncbi:MAG: bifunctional adenosylcobinamide kinase/adenosylcobinamide-phosphate guanylyltransferase [Oscillospiraceae bacterium]|nr:bifunctional adenosylcobinamide kinase/adenosylcobinamide-phosphate guanylyltransferase [Oscillospiraceae bacterium]